MTDIKQPASALSSPRFCNMGTFMRMQKVDYIKAAYMTEGLSMDIKYFEYVIEIVECGSINKAAQNLQMLQPNLSVCIKNLEQELGFPIFRRQHSGIR